MTVVVIRDVAARFRGFLSSCMLEVAPGVYTAPRMTCGVRERLWVVLEEWHACLGGGSIVLTWKDPALPCGQGLRVLGVPPVDLYDHEGVVLSRRPWKLKRQDACPEADDDGMNGG